MPDNMPPVFPDRCASSSPAIPHATKHRRHLLTRDTDIPDSAATLDSLTLWHKLG